jgi:hypothetical protein
MLKHGRTSRLQEEQTPALPTPIIYAVGLCNLERFVVGRIVKPVFYFITVIYSVVVIYQMILLQLLTVF